MRNYRPSTNNSAISYSKRTAIQQHCCNVMEALVVEEVEKQVHKLPPKVASYVKISEVVAYALNRLPSLYATSRRGWQRQIHYGKTELSEKIAISVRQGIAAVQRDPLRVNDPLNFQEDKTATLALEYLKNLLQRQDLSWEELPNVVEEALLNTTKGKITWRQLNKSNDDIFDWSHRRF
jgi:hypothetical protein